MDVRCAGCHRDVSEWAARCPDCGRSLDDAELVAAPDPTPPLHDAELVAAPDPTPPLPPPGVRLQSDGPIRVVGSAKGTTRKRVALVVVAILAVAAVGIGVLDPGLHPASRNASIGPSRGTRPPITATPITGSHSVQQSRRPRLPAGLASERLFFAEPGRTGLYRADGTRLTDPQGLAGIGYPLEPLVSGQGIVVYIHGNDAYRTAGPSAVSSVDLGAASSIFPALRGAIGIETGGEGATTSVEYMAADGTVPAPGTASLQLPPGITAVAQVPSGLVVAGGATPAGLLSEVTRVRLSLIRAHSTINLGVATDVIGVHGATVAEVNCPPRRPSSCSLTLVDTTTRRLRVIRPPPEYVGYALGGGFSPDGSRLAAFVQSSPFEDVTSLRLVLVDLVTGTVSVTGLYLLANDPAVGDATWSADGRWLFFGSPSGTFDAERITRRGPTGLPWELTLTTSLAVTGA
jgi:hypothetical protein